MKVAFLSDPRNHCAPVDRVEVRETHTAFVFLAGETAYKLKKPVRFSFLDFSRLPAREHACREEVRLNAQIAGDVYRGVVRLTVEDDGRLALGGKGTVADWLVEMARLPDSEMLDRRIEAGTVQPADIDRLGGFLMRFYKRQRETPVHDTTYVDHLVAESALTADHLIAMGPSLACGDLPAILDRAAGVLAAHRGEIDDRIATGCIVEGHGDLRPEHICLTDPPVAFDRLEFAPSMLPIDIYDEVNYLGLECGRLGAGWIGAQLLDLFERGIGDRPSIGLLDAYGAFRLLLRARLAIDHLRDADPRTPEKWPSQAKSYLDAARALLPAR